MLLGVIISVILISKQLNYSFSDMVSAIQSSEYSQVLFFDFNDKRFFLKQFISGAFIAIVMTGLDQEINTKKT